MITLSRLCMTGLVMALLPAHIPVAVSGQRVRIAVIGDFGIAGTPARDVATLVKSWNPDAVLTLGDNNYPAGSAATIDANIGQYYSDYIYPYTGQYTRSLSAPAVNRFFPGVGQPRLGAPRCTALPELLCAPG